MDKKLYSKVEDIIIRWANDNTKTAGHLTREIMAEIYDDLILKSLKTLEDNGVYIHYSPEHYTDGSNLNFSIEFTKQNTQTGWYNDDHEFGDVYDTTVKSLKLAQWYLEDPKRIELIDGSMKDPEYIKYLNDLCDFLETIVTPITVMDITKPNKFDFKVKSKEELENDRSNAYDYLA